MPRVHYMIVFSTTREEEEEEEEEEDYSTVHNEKNCWLTCI